MSLLKRRKSVGRSLPAHKLNYFDPPSGKTNYRRNCFFVQSIFADQSNYRKESTVKSLEHSVNLMFGLNTDKTQRPKMYKN